MQVTKEKIEEAEHDLLKYLEAMHEHGAYVSVNTDDLTATIYLTNQSKVGTL